MRFTKAQIVIIGIVILLIIGLVVLLTAGRRQSPEAQLSGEINFWGVFDSLSVMRQLISSYNATRPGVRISYTQINPDTYENDLVNALAGSRGPDVFMMHNTWLPKHFDKVIPLSAVTQALTISGFQNIFPTVAEQDFAPDGVIFALPLYIDTLTLFYNKDFFDEKGIAVPPTNWDEFQAMIPRLRELDSAGRIIKAAAAIGGSNKSIANGTDILNLLMMQTGTQMVDDGFTRATFSNQSGREALSFYVDFANPQSRFFTWNENLPFSLDFFSQGNAAMMFGYASDIPRIREKNPFLRFDTLPMLQPSNVSRPVSWANYWGLTVSRKTNNALAAWDFALYLTTNFEAQRQYAELTQKPPALRSLINQLINDPFWGKFVRQSLTARSWPHIDGTAVRNIFSQMIENVLSGRLSISAALSEAERQVTALMQRR